MQFDRTGTQRRDRDVLEKKERKNTSPCDLLRFRRIRAKFAPIVSPRLIEHAENPIGYSNIRARRFDNPSQDRQSAAVNPAALKRNGGGSGRIRFDIVIISSD